MALTLSSLGCSARLQQDRERRPQRASCSSYCSPGAGGLKQHQGWTLASRPCSTRRRTSQTVYGSAAFADESHRAFYEAPAPLSDLSHKKATKLAKKLRKQRENLFKLAASVPLNGDALNGMVAELDRAHADVLARAQEREGSSSSSSDGEEKDMRLALDAARDCEVAEPAGHVDDTDASLLVDKLRSQKKACSSSSTGGGYGHVCAMSVEERVRGPPSKVFVCEGKCCARKGAGAVRAAVEASDWAANGEVTVVSTDCLGKCKKGAAIRIKAGAGRPELITRIDESQVDDVLEFKLNNSFVQVAVPVL